MQPIARSVTLERFGAITRHASEITLTLNSLFKLTLKSQDKEFGKLSLF